MKRRQLALLAVILAAAALAYLPSMRGDFTTDEFLLILNNPQVQHPQGFGSFFSDKFWTGKAKGIYYRPVIIMSYALNWRLSRESTFSYHLLNLLFFMGSVVLLFYLVRRLLPECAPLAAAIYALHPVHGESVAWIPGRTDTLAVFFILAAWLLWMKAARPGPAPGKIVIYITMAAVLLLGLLSKEIAVLAPALFLVSDWWEKPGDEGLGPMILKRVWGYALVLLSIALYFWLRHWAFTGGGEEPAPAFLAGFPLWEKPLMISRIWTEYLWLLVWPHPVRTDAYYSANFAAGAYPAWPGLISGIFWAGGLAAMAWGFARRNRWAMIAVLWLLSLLPVSHLAPFPNAMATRFLLLPSVFFAMGLGLAISRCAKFFPQISRGAGALVLVFFFALSLGVNSGFRDRYLYLREVVSQAPGGAVAHNQLGLAALDRDWLETAEKEFNWALANSPDYPEALVNLSLVKLKQGQFDSALELLQKAISISPDYAEAHYNLGLALKSAGRSAEAFESFEKAADLEPGKAGAYYEMARLRLEQNDWKSAAELSDRALKAAPWHAGAIKLRARIAISEGDFALARELIERAEKLSGPDLELGGLRNATEP